MRHRLTRHANDIARRHVQHLQGDDRPVALWRLQQPQPRNAIELLAVHESSTVVPRRYRIHLLTSIHAFVGREVLGFASMHTQAACHARGFYPRTPLTRGALPGHKSPQAPWHTSDSAASIFHITKSNYHLTKLHKK